MVEYKVSDATKMLISTTKSRCVIWAMFITAFAREKLYRCIDILGDDFLYTDTDSIFTTATEEELYKKFAEIGEEIHPKNLGAWAIEGRSPLFKMIRAKCYLKTDDSDKEPGVHRLNYVIAGYNGTELINGYVNKDIKEINEYELQYIFDDFKIGKICHDKETSIMCEFGIRQLKKLTDYEIRDKVYNTELIR